MADTIGNFDPSTQDAAACGFSQPIKGDGYALTIDPANGKHRYDVWVVADFHRACPVIGYREADKLEILCKLGWDAQQAGNVEALRRVTAFGRELQNYHG